MASAAATSQDGQVVGSEPLADADAKWISLRAIDWIDPRGNKRRWESADRRTRRDSGVDAVAVLTLVERGGTTSVLLVSQFRPPVGKSVIELPAGLIDSGETAETAAVRELAEETGYQGTLVSTSPVLHNDPGLTGANMQLCVVRVSVAPDAPPPVAHPEEGEFIESHLVPLDQFYQRLKEFTQQGYAVDARLAHLGVGLEIGLGKLGS